jgi:hypothetical protein
VKTTAPAALAAPLMKSRRVCMVASLFRDLRRCQGQASAKSVAVTRPPMRFARDEFGE